MKWSRQDKATGRFIKTSKDVLVSCPCGADFKTTSSRIDSGRGKYCSKGCSHKYRKKYYGPEHPRWKEKVDYTTSHQWVYRKLGQPSKCENCSTKKGIFHWANLSGNYKRNVSDWARLCSVCHHAIDNIAVRGWQTKKGGA